MKISEKWEMYSGLKPGFLTQKYLNKKFQFENRPALLVNGAVCPDTDLWQTIKSLKPNQSLWFNQTLLAIFSDNPTEFHTDHSKETEWITWAGSVTIIQKSWHIFQFNGSEIRNDFDLMTEGRSSEPILDPHTIVYNSSQIFIEKGVKIKAAVLNAEAGPIYIGKDSEIQEGAIIRGPFALCEASTVNMGAKIRGDTTVGPHSKIGGEVSNSVIFGYSNKSHDGFMGNSVLGEWCNLGADTNTSNLKNNYATVKLWDYTRGGFTNTGLQFCGLMMGDHSKCGINSMFNTGTVVGVGANVFGDGYPRNFIPSFSWGGASGFTTFQLKKFGEVAVAVMRRRGLDYDEIEKEILQKVFELTKHYRIWDKEVQ